MTSRYVLGRAVRDLTLTELLELEARLTEERRAEELEDEARRAGCSTFFARLQRR